MLALRKENGIFRLTADTYTLVFAKDRPFLFLNDPDGQRLAELFVFSSVHPFHGRDDVPGLSSWDANKMAAPRLGAPGWPWEVQDGSQEICLSLTVESTAWESKTYRFRCEPKRFSYEIELAGEGSLCEVNYFGGYSSCQVRWGSGFFESGQRFRRGFTPEPNKMEQNYFSPAGGEVIDLLGVPLPGKKDWFFTPPPFQFAFQVPQGWVGLGVEGRLGDFRFTEYAYHGRLGAFHLSLSYEGHTAVNGYYRLPAIGFDFGRDEWEVLAAHVQALGRTGATRPAQPPNPKPAWWSQPIFCGWGSQCYLSDQLGGAAPDYARQEHYNSFLQVLEEQGIDPGIVVLDDKWQATYGENEVDPAKWPDLPGFILAQHAKGRKVLLWLKAWDPQGLPTAECITNARGLPLALDPTNPTCAARLRRAVRRMLSPGGYDADGFKIDFTARLPSGPGIQVHGDLWGLELMKRYLAILYDEAKRVKPDALVIAHTPHPYLADVLDMIRLNDINPDREVCESMSLRARVASIACPDALIDTDNWPLKDRASWRRYLRLQPELGIPSLYCVTHIDTTGEPLEEQDYALIRETWRRYRAKVASQASVAALDKDQAAELLGPSENLFISLENVPGGLAGQVSHRRDANSRPRRWAAGCKPQGAI